MAYNQFNLPSGSLEHDSLLRNDNIHMILRYIAAMYSGSEYELRYLVPIRSMDKFSIGQMSPSSSWSGSIENQLATESIFRVLGPTGYGIIQQGLTVGHYTLDSTASLFVSGTVRIQGGSPTSGAILSAINTQGHAVWVSSSLLGGGGSGSTTVPGGANNTIQYNNNGTFSGSTHFTFNSSSNHITVSGAISSSYGLNTVGFFGTASWALNAITASYVTTLRASAPSRSIQFNENNLLSGSNSFTIDPIGNVLYATQSFQLLGNEKIRITGSEAGLQIIGLQTSQSVLDESPYVIATDRQSTLIYAESGSTFGQIWYVQRPFSTYYGSAHIYDITSSLGDLRYRGTIGTTPAIGRLQGHGVYRNDISRLLILGLDPNSSQEMLLAYNPSTIGLQPLNFTASVGSAYELSLIDYSCSLKNNDGGIISTVYTPAYGYNNNPVINISCSSGVMNVVFGYATSSFGSSTTPLLTGTTLSASLNALSASSLPLENAATEYPIGMFISTFDASNPSQEYYIDITTNLIDSTVPLDKIFSGSFNGNTLTASSNKSWIGAYNQRFQRLYCLIDLINNNNLNAILEYDCASMPPNLLTVYTSSAALTQLGAIAVDEVTKTVAVRENGQIKIFDASTTVNWATPLQTITVPLSYRNIFGYSSSFYDMSYTYPAGGSGTGPRNLIVVNKISQSSGTFTNVSGTIPSYFTGSNISFANASSPAYAFSINKLFIADRSNIADTFNTDVMLSNEDRINTFARAGFIYSMDTSSLVVSAVYSPYSSSFLNGPNNLAEFRQANNQLMSYIDEYGIFVGTSNLAYTASFSLLAFQSASISGNDLSLFRGNGTASIIPLPISSGSSGSATTPGGINKSIQFNDSNIFNGANNFVFGATTSSLSYTGSLFVSGNIDGENAFFDNAALTILSAGEINSPAITGSLLGTSSFAISASYVSFAVSASHVTDPTLVHKAIDGFQYSIPRWDDTTNIVPLNNIQSNDTWLKLNALTGIFTPGDPFNLLTVDANTVGDMRYGIDLTGSLNISGSTIVTGSYSQSGSAYFSGTIGYDLDTKQKPFRVEFYDDFVAPFIASSNTFIITVTSGAASLAANSTPEVDCTTGRVRLVTGTTTLGRAAINTNNTAITAGAGTKITWASRVKISQSSDNTNNFTCSIGMGDSTTNPNHTDGIYFYYNHNADAGAWTFRTRHAGVQTTSSITFPFTASAYHLFRINVNATGTSASAFIDDTFMGYLTSNIPTGSATFSMTNVGIYKNGGTATRALDCDFVYIRMFPPSRSLYQRGWDFDLN